MQACESAADGNGQHSRRASRGGVSRTHGGVARLASVVAIAMTLAACATKWREHEAMVEPGMSQAEVLELLGEPSSKVNVPSWGEQPAYVRWQWNDNLSTLATGAMFPDTVPDRVLAVSFDAEGKVSEVVLPREPNP